jgi:hypothetical protein
MSKSIKVPISKMIDLLNKISSGGGISSIKNPNSNSSKVSFLFQHEISMFYSHFTLTRNILEKSADINSVVKYQILFRKYISAIFSLFFKIKSKYISKKRKLAACFVKRLPNYRLYLKTKKIINRFMEKEESKFNLDKIRKSMFLINKFLEDDDENITDVDSKNGDNNCDIFINNNVNNINDNC